MTKQPLIVESLEISTFFFHQRGSELHDESEFSDFFFISFAFAGFFARV